MSSWGKPSPGNLKPVGQLPGAQPPAKKNEGAHAKAPASQTSSWPLSLTQAPVPVVKTEAQEPAQKAPTGPLRAAAGKVWEDPTLADWNPNDFRVFVGNLSKEVSDTVLRTAFAAYPSLSNSRVVKDKKTGHHKGYGFVAFSDAGDYARAMKEMNGKYVGSKPIKMTRSSWKDRNFDGKDTLIAIDKALSLTGEGQSSKEMGANLRFQIAVEEAKAGYTPQIKWCKAVAKKEQIKGRSNDLEVLRGDKIKSKLYCYGKQAAKMVKKAKTFEIRKVTRRLKSGTVQTKKAALETKLAALKSVDHTKLGAALLTVVLKSDKLAWSRVKVHHKPLETEGVDLTWLAKEKEALLKDIQEFLAKLFHDNEVKEGETQERKSDSKDESRDQDECFVASLNQNQKQRKKAPRYDESEMEEDTEPRKKKNRLGQRARREMWEKQYGDKAKHIRKAKAEKLKHKKQSQREYIAERQQNTFRSERQEPVKDLHPSWAAKLAQKKQASSGPSERIVFSED